MARRWAGGLFLLSFDYVLWGQVYNLTTFMDDHPGGDDVLLQAAGKYGTHLCLGIRKEC